MSTYTNKFIDACENGKLEIVKYLIDTFGVKSDVNPNGIDIHAKNERAFIVSCGILHLGIVKYLIYLLGVKNKDSNPNVIDIHADNDYAFKFACNLKHIELAQFLASLDERYMITIENNKIINWGIRKEKFKFRFI